MKKFFMIACMMLMSTAMFAQNEAGKMAIGVQGSYGLHKDYKNFGAGIKFQYNITEAFRGEAAGNYFFKKDYVSMWDANINFHYLIPIGDKLNVYPIVGATLVGVKLDVGGAGFSGSFNDFLIQNGVPEDQISTIQKYAPEQYNELKREYESLKGEIGDSSSESKFGFNAGAGIEYFISENFKINFEAKYQYVKDFDRPVLTIGAAYVF